MKRSISKTNGLLKHPSPVLPDAHCYKQLILEERKEAIKLEPSKLGVVGSEYTKKKNSTFFWGGGATTMQHLEFDFIALIVKHFKLLQVFHPSKLAPKVEF